MNITKKAPRADGATPKGAVRCASALILAQPVRAVKSEAIPIYIRGRVVGYVEDGVFRKRLRGSVHFLRRPPAIAFDLSTLYDAQSAGAERVHITDTETGREYVARIDDILRDGKRFDRGFGKQIYYLLTRWRAPDTPEQLSLFGDGPPPDNEVGNVRHGLAAEPDAPPLQGSAPPRNRFERREVGP